MIEATNSSIYCDGCRKREGYYRRGDPTPHRIVSTVTLAQLIEPAKTLRICNYCAAAQKYICHWCASVHDERHNCRRPKEAA